MIGERIHSYEVNAHLGQGGMGNVFRATDTMLGREVALKMLHPQLTMQPQFLDRFKKEARVLAQLLHPNIAVIYNFIEQEGNHFMVMEYVEGITLDDLLKKYGVLPAEFVVPVCIQALEGLRHAHRKNIFHRDIKPANLMLTGEATLKLMDFGIARVAGEQKMTQVNKIVGTIEFMAPELIEGKDASAASDIYAMGVTMYEMACGKIPFEADTDFNLMQAILKSKPRHPGKFNDKIPKVLEEIILKAMDRNPANRYRDAYEFQQALVNAFPRYREIDASILENNLQPFSGHNARAGLETVIQSSPATGAGSDIMRPRFRMAMPLAALSRYKEKMIGDKRIRFALLGVLLFLGIVFSVNMIRGNKDNMDTAALKDSVAGTQPSITGLSRDETGDIGVAVPVSQPGIQEKPPPLVKENEKHEEKEATTPVRKTRRENSEAGNNLVGPDEKEKEEEPTPVQKSPEPQSKTIYINYPVSVTLSLATTPDMNEKKKSSQNVRFTVTRPVYYNSVMIVKAGATATGTITVGRVMTDIEINTVEAVNGKRISLKAEKAHGRRSDIEEGKNFSAQIQQGTRIDL